MLGPRQQHRVREVQVLKLPLHPIRLRELMQNGEGFFASTADPVRISPLFKTSTLRKFQLHLDSVVKRGGATEYLLSFAVKRANHRSTGTYQMAGYSGRLRVRQADYAVTHYEALCQSDTVTINAIARQHHGQHDRIEPFYPNLYADARTDHVAEYVLGTNGRYQLHHSTAKGISSGRKLGGQPFYRQSFYELYLGHLPVATPLPALDPRMANDEIYQLFKAKPDLAFWQTYRRPMAENK